MGVTDDDARPLGISDMRSFEDSSKSSIPFVGEVTEENTTLASSNQTTSSTSNTDNTSSSWIFPTAALSQMEDTQTPASSKPGNEETDPNYAPSPQLQALEDRLNALLNRPIGGSVDDDVDDKKKDLSEEAQDREIVPEAGEGSDQADLSHSIQKLGALLGSTMTDQDQADDHAEEADAGVDTDEDDDLLDALLDSEDEKDAGEKMAATKTDEMEDLLEEAFDAPIENSQGVPEDSTSRLDDFLTDALEGSQSNFPPEDSQGGMDEVLDAALDAAAPAPESKVAPKPNVSVKNTATTATRTQKPKPTNQPQRSAPKSSKLATSTKSSTKGPRQSLLSRVTKPLTRRSTKQSTSTTPARKPAVSSFNSSSKRQPTTKTPSRKASLPRFNNVSKSTKPKVTTQSTTSPRSRKPPVPIFRTPQHKKEPKRSVFNIGKRTQPEQAPTQPRTLSDDSPQTKAGMRRSKKILSKLTGWTSRRSSTNTASKTKVPRSPTATKLSLPKSRVRTAPSFDHSISSASTQTSIFSYNNPRRAGARTGLGDYNPYMFGLRAPCELCIYHLSDDERAMLHANGRHLRVMFTRGGVVNSEVFPRGADEPPVRLCRTCFGSSHRHPSDMNEAYRGVIRGARRHFEQKTDERIFSV